MKMFKRWMKDSTGAAKKDFAKKAKTNFMYLYQIAAGTRAVSAEFAADLEKASEGLFSRGDMSKTCGKCPYYKKCK